MEVIGGFTITSIVAETLLEVVQVNTYTTSGQARATVTVDNGAFLVAWDSDNQEGKHYEVYGQLYDASGGKIGLSLIHLIQQTGIPPLQRLTMEILSRYGLMVKENDDDIHAQIYQANETKLETSSV